MTEGSDPSTGFSLGRNLMPEACRGARAREARSRAGAHRPATVHQERLR